MTTVEELEKQVKADRVRLEEHQKRCKRVFALCQIIYARGGEERKKLKEIMNEWWLDNLNSLNEMKKELLKCQ